MGIDDCRKRIDELDARLVELLSERSRVVAEIGKLKREAGQLIYQPDREREILERVQALNPGPLRDEALKRLFERILDEARALEQEAAGEIDS
jgi:chorismate mutase-like protein